MLILPHNSCPLALQEKYVPQTHMASITCVRGAQCIDKMTYEKAVDFLKKDRETPPVTIVGRAFDVTLDTSIGKAIIGLLDKTARYVLDVENEKKQDDVEEPIAAQKSFCEKNQLQLFIPNVPNANMTRLINNTITITLLFGETCSLFFQSQKICIQQNLNSFFANKVLVRGFYNISNATKTYWEYNKSSALEYQSWSIQAVGSQALPMQFMEELQKGLDQVVSCEEKTADTVRWVLFPISASIALFGGVFGYLYFRGEQGEEEKSLADPLIAHDDVIVQLR